MAGLNGTMNIARSGITAQQAAIDTTSHNISNSSTDGYSRQRVTMDATFYNGAGEFDSRGPQAGTGVAITDIARVRDMFLDYAFRRDTSSTGYAASVKSYLDQLQHITQEPSQDGLATQINNFFSAWSKLEGGAASDPTARKGVVEATQALTNQLNSAYKKLQQLKDDCKTTIGDYVKKIDGGLNDLDDLNTQIIKLEYVGDTPNDLMDERDQKVEQLCTYFNVDQDVADNGGLTLKAGGASSDENLVQPVDADKEKRLSFVNSINAVVDGGGNPVTDAATGNPVYKITYYRNGDKDNPNNTITMYANLSSSDYDSLSKYGILMADVKGNATVNAGAGSRDGASQTTSFKLSDLNLFSPTDGSIKGIVDAQSNIDNAINSLNTFAKALAFTVNTIESGQSTVDSSDTSAHADSEPFFVNGDTAKYSLVSGNATGFSTKYTDTDEEGITAGNITLNQMIVDNNAKIKTRTNDNKYNDESLNTTDGPNDGNRAKAIASMQNILLNISSITGISSRNDFITANGGLVNNADGIAAFHNYDNGTTSSDYYRNIIDAVGNEASEADRNYATQNSTLNATKNSRTAVSGVSVDEEITNLIQYQHAYQANAKVISTVADLLDVVIGLVR
ncbi:MULTISPECIES: flagellar hook-associated protein FlgK [Clostridium]|uniref:flagellar hook-associated protein FlgK n=1 Tax=Clostridium TaxID=1485 RepID=UPI0008243975|nr:MULTISPECIES: flagellar hook-associated protein FlgK [Clostridium]PJI09821.1 flagellar hook-associated protein FlgK [Clostridium sp. CT7]